ncbi:MAG: hypothetical protein ACI9WU_000062 [Myxococcota bacterium]|jgi:hypothetical protein
MIGWFAAALAVIAPPSPVPDLSGTWAHQLITASVAELPVVGRTLSRTRSYVLWRIEQNGTRLTIHEQLCRVRMQGHGDSVRVSLSGGLVKALKRSKRTARLDKSPIGWRFVAPAHHRALGARLTDGPAERLPEDPDDPRVYDQDRDGAPGITVQIRGLVTGDIHIVQRDWSALSAPVDDSRPRTLDGDVRWGSEQRVLSSTSGLLKTLPKSSPELARSKFRTTRIAAKSGCSDLMRNIQGVFLRE